MQLRIGLSDTSKEFELDVPDPDAVVTAYQEALAAGEPLFWVTDDVGKRYAILAGRVAYFEMPPPQSKKVGFGI